MKQLMLITPQMASKAVRERFRVRCLTAECWAAQKPLETIYLESAETIACNHARAHYHEVVVEEIE